MDRDRAHAMLAGARIREDAKTLLRAEAESTAEKIANLACTQRSKDKSPNELFDGKKSKLQAEHLVEFGRIGYVTIRTKIKKKWIDKSFKGIMVGYATDHSPDTYRIYNPETGAVIMTRDVKWADWVETDPTESMKLFETLKIPELSKVGIDEDLDESDHEDEQPPHVIPDDEDETSDQELGRNDVSGSGTMSGGGTGSETATTAATKTRDEDREQRAKTTELPWTTVETRSKSKARQQAASRIAPTPIAVIEEEAVGANLVFTAELSSDPGEPKTWQQAFQGPHAEVWMESAASEIMNFIKRKAWKKVCMKTVLEAGRKPIPTKVVLKTKFEHDGSIRNKTRIVTKGFHMIPGVDYTESFSPVAMATSNRTAMVISLFFMNGRGSAKLQVKCDRGKWVMEMFDVEAAFLNAKYEGKKKMFIAIPEIMEILGFVTEEDRQKYAIELMVSMYGNVDSALMFFKTYSSTLLKIGLTQSRIDPCVFFKHDDTGHLILMLCCHIDDTTISGYQNDVKEFLDEFETHLAIERLGQVRKHLGVWYEWKRDDEGIYVVASMNKMVDEIDEAFQEATGKRAKFAKTPGFPGKMLSKNEGEIVNINAYRSLVGKLLYYMTKVAPEMANAVRDLSSHMSNPGEDHWKSLERCIGYLVHLAMEKRGLVFRNPKELRSISSYADGDYAKCEDTRRSISGNLNTIGGTLTNFCSKKQDTVALSTAESELNSYSLCYQEALFQNALLEELLNVKPEPAIIMEDNMGCIFMIKNQRVGQRTKHIDTRASFTRQHYQQRKVMPIFTRTELMYADGMTKNLPKSSFAEHARVIRDGNLPCCREDVELVEDVRDKDDVSHESHGT